MNIFLNISFNICFGCSKEPSQRDGSFEFPQRIVWLRNKKINFYFLRTLMKACFEFSYEQIAFLLKPCLGQKCMGHIPSLTILIKWGCKIGISFNHLPYFIRY